MVPYTIFKIYSTSSGSSCSTTTGQSSSPATCMSWPPKHEHVLKDGRYSHQEALQNAKTLVSGLEDYIPVFEPWVATLESRRCRRGTWRRGSRKMRPGYPFVLIPEYNTWDTAHPNARSTRAVSMSSRMHPRSRPYPAPHSSRPDMYISSSARLDSDRQLVTRGQSSDRRPPHLRPPTGPFTQGFKEGLQFGSSSYPSIQDIPSSQLLPSLLPPPSYVAKTPKTSNTGPATPSSPNTIHST